MQLTDDITVLKGVGPALAAGLRQLGIKTVFDLLDYIPRRYEDYSHITAIRNLHPGPVTIQATVMQASGRYVRRGMHITEALFRDATGTVRATWFNQPYRADSLKTGQEYYVSGKYELSYNRFQLTSPSAELVKDFPLNTARIIPVYRQSKTVSTNQIRKLIGSCIPLLHTVPETLPGWIVTDYNLPSRAEAIRAMHYPASADQLAEARRRLGFEEVFQLSLASLLNKQEISREQSLQIPFDQKMAQTFVAHLPFTLTSDQRRVVWQIYQDMQKPHPMNRLVEGDVGSGKTVVAAMAAVMALRQGYQVALMAPTELLAKQHAETIYQLLRPLGLEHEVLLLLGATAAAKKKQAQSAIEHGHAKLLIGTHALIQEKVVMRTLGLVIIDEQHRFGVDQRKALMAKAGLMPHVLLLTATPIPRSLALTLYGELDVSILRDKPSGRTPITTKLVSPNSREPMYAAVLKAVQAGRQAFVVCPLITGDNQAGDTVNSAESTYEHLRTHVFANLRVGLLHGKLKAVDKHAVMQEFAAGKLDVLVATTVVEVGVDVPNATIMIIESADRFGLAQLHQLRGRVGRGQHAGQCYLVLSDSKSPTKRLRAIESSQDGFKLAELDLEIRGPGAIYGQSQHGALDMRIAQLSDRDLITSARLAAQTFVNRSEDLLQYTELAARVIKLRAVTNLN
jgi:ATP-dependent DNA helicase RecG